MLIEQRERFERLLGRKMSNLEFDRLVRLGEITGAKADDPIWEIWLGMEFQRSFYDEIPAKIRADVEELLSALREAAQLEAKMAQATLAESVVESAKKLSVKLSWFSLCALGVLGILLLLSFGSLMMWAGYCLGSGQTHPPAMILRMPAGMLISGILFITGIGFGVGAARAYSNGFSWTRLLIFSLTFFVVGAFFLQFFIWRIQVASATPSRLNEKAR